MQEWSSISDETHTLTFTVHKVTVSGRTQQRFGYADRSSITTTRYNSIESEPISVTAQGGSKKFELEHKKEPKTTFAIKKNDYYIIPTAYIMNDPDIRVLKGLRKLGLLSHIGFGIFLGAWIPWIAVINIAGFSGGYNNSFWGYGSTFVIASAVLCLILTVLTIYIFYQRRLLTHPDRWLKKKLPQFQEGDGSFLFVPTWCLKRLRDVAVFKRIWVIEEVGFAYPSDNIRFQHNVAYDVVGKWSGSSPWSTKLPKTAVFESIARELSTNILVGQNAMAGLGPWFLALPGRKTVTWPA
jgi:hypothetical protein